MNQVGLDMVIDRVDADNRPIGKVRRRDVFREEANFRVVHIFVFNHRGELLLQKIPPHRLRHPNRWGSSVAAYLFADEDPLEGAQRRLRQELGIGEAALQYILETKMKDRASLKFITLFRLENNGPFRPDPTHIEALRFQPIEEIDQTLKRSRQAFTPTFRHLFNEYQKQRRSKSSFEC